MEITFALVIKGQLGIFPDLTYDLIGLFAQSPLKGPLNSFGNSNQQPAGCLAIENFLYQHILWGNRNILNPQLCTQTTTNSHFCYSHSQTTVRNIVTGINQAFLDKIIKFEVTLPGRNKVDLGDISA